MKHLNKAGLAFIFAAATVGTFASANAQEVQPLMSSNLDLAPGQTRTEITGKVESVGIQDVWVRSEDGKVYDVRLTAHATTTRPLDELAQGETVIASGANIGSAFYAAYLDLGGNGDENILPTSAVLSTE